MTLNDIYLKSKDILKNTNIENFSFDAMEILKKTFNIDRQYFLLHRNEVINNSKSEEFFNLIKKRSLHEPLQYILNEWSFMGLDFNIGEGVLIPRDDTEVLVKESIEELKNIKSPKILELCGGSGIISIVLGKEFPDAKIFSIEVSNKAKEYFLKNIKKHKVNNIKLIKKDIFSDIDKDWAEKFDIIISNPPYILYDDLKTLQEEVKFEPTIALNGGKDGLDFYREIASKWTKTLKNNRKILVEVGIKQFDKVSQIFRNNNLNDICVYKDINNIERVVKATKKGF